MNIRVLPLLLAVLFFGGCPAVVPQGVGSNGATPVPAGGEVAPARDTESGESSNVPSEPSNPSMPADSPASVNANQRPQDLFAKVNAPQAGGVSALPADVEGGDGAKTAFQFTIEGAGDPVCREPSGKNTFYSAFTKNKYHVTGRVGAVLMDGTVVPLYGCGQVAVRFQEGVGDSARCATVRVEDDCEFSLYFSSRQIDQAQVYIFTHYLNPGLQIPPDYNPCGDMDNMREPAKNEITFASAGRENLPLCVSPAIDGSILANPNFQSKIPR